MRLLKCTALALALAFGPLAGCTALSGALGQTQILPAAPSSVTSAAQTALNKAKVGITFAAGAVHTAGDGMKFAASVGLLKGSSAAEAKIAYDTGVSWVNKANDAAVAAQAAIDAGMHPDLQSINEAIAKATAAVATIKGVTPGST